MLPSMHRTPRSLPARPGFSRLAAGLALLLVLGCVRSLPAATKPCGWYFGGPREGVAWLSGVWVCTEVDSHTYVEWTFLPRQNGTMPGVLRVTPGGPSKPTGAPIIRLTVIREQADGGIVLEEDGHPLRLVESGKDRAVFADASSGTKLTVRFLPDGSGLLVWTREEGGKRQEWRLYREV